MHSRLSRHNYGSGVSRRTHEACGGKRRRNCLASSQDWLQGCSQAPQLLRQRPSQVLTLFAFPFQSVCKQSTHIGVCGAAPDTTRRQGRATSQGASWTSKGRPCMHSTYLEPRIKAHTRDPALVSLAVGHRHALGHTAGSHGHGRCAAAMEHAGS